MGPEEFRAAGHELIDWIADYRARIPELPVQAQVDPGEVAGQLPKNAPEEAEPFARLLADLDAIVVPGVTQVQHPRYFGWFPSNATLSSALGDLATAGLGALGITWQSAPALTRRTRDRPGSSAEPWLPERARATTSVAFPPSLI